MSINRGVTKFLRFIGIVLMGLTSGFTLLGGVGTTCVALSPTRYESMTALAPFQWLYVLFVLAGIALGIWGIRATIMLIRGADQAYRESVIMLLAGASIGVLHMLVSQMLRGKSMPVDAVVYTTLLTLVIFLVFRIPSIWQLVDFSRGDARSNQGAGSAAAILLGVLCLTIQYTMGTTHTWNGVNYADAFNLTMSVFGMVCLLVGAGLILRKHKKQRIARTASIQI